MKTRHAKPIGSYSHKGDIPPTVINTKKAYRSPWEEGKASGQSCGSKTESPLVIPRHSISHLTKHPVIGVSHDQERRPKISSVPISILIRSGCVSALNSPLVNAG